MPQAPQCPHCQQVYEFPATSQQRQLRRRAESQSRRHGVEVQCRSCKQWFTWRQTSDETERSA